MAERSPLRPVEPALPAPHLHDVAAPDGLDLRRVLEIARNRLFIILTVALAIFAFFAVRALREQKTYTAEVSLVIELQAPKVLGDQVQDVGESQASFWQTKDFFETQFLFLKSRAVAERVVRKLALDRDAAFLGVAKIKDPAKRQQAMRKADAAAILQAQLRVEPVRDSHVVRVLVDDSDPHRAALLANTVADEFIAFNLDERLGTSRSASEWLHDQMDELQGKLGKSEQALYDFKRANDILTASIEDSQSIVGKRLQAISDALTQVREERAVLSAKVAQVERARAAGKLGDLPQALASPLLTGERTQAQALGLELSEAHTRYGEDHPRIVALEQKLKSAQVVIADEEERIAQSALIEEAQASGTEANLKVLLEGVKREALAVNSKEVDYSRLRREQENNAKIVEMVLKRLKDVDLAGLLRTNNIRLLDAAEVPVHPSAPNLRFALLLGLLFGLLGGGGAAVLVEQLDTTLKTQEDVERASRAAFLGIIPAVREPMRAPDGGAEQVASVDLYIHERPRSSVAECLRAVRTNLLFLGTEKPLQKILVTSSGPQEGKTTAVIDLGITFAQSGQRVLLVDTDLRRPRLHRAFQLAQDIGLTSVLLDEQRLGEAIRPTAVPNLFVLPCGPIPPNPAELLHTERFRALVAELSRRFDRVLFDSPPVAAVTDAQILAAQVDGVVLLAKAGKTSKEALGRARRQLSDVNARVVGALLNSVDLGSRGAGYYYDYYGRYGAYYGDGDAPPKA